MTKFLSILEKRRSIYSLDNKTDITNKQIINAIEQCVKHTPTSFNSQTGRVVILFNEAYQKLWKKTLEILKDVTPSQNFDTTKKKIQSFSKGIGTVLFFEEQHTIRALEEKFPLYKDNFHSWSEQSSGMLQFAVWLALTDLGLGANLQHYNPLIDEEVHKLFSVPTSWRLISQMNFGTIKEPAGEKTYLDINKRCKNFQTAE